MFYVNDNAIMADDIVVLNELKTQLEINGILRFGTGFKVGTDNIQFPCPIHKDGQESKPSCGVLTTNKKRDDRIIKAGRVHCFTCGYDASLEEMISHCFGKSNDFGNFGREWLIKNFLTISIENRKEIQLDLGRGSSVIKKSNYIMEEQLDGYRYYHDYMFKRRLTEEIIALFDIGYDSHFELKSKDGKSSQVLRCITFPVHDINGNVLFIGRRSVDTKLFHYPEGVEKPVYGIYQLPSDADEIIVCESFFNGLTCWVYGKYGVAMMGLGTPMQYEQLKRLPCRKIITAFDPDEAGQRATQRLKDAMKGYKLVTSYIVPEGKDINDLTKEEFDNLEEIF